MGKLRLSKVKGWCSVNAVPSWPPGMCAVGPITWATQDEADDLGTSWDKAGDEVRAVQPLGGGFSCRPPAWAGELGTKGLMSLGGREEEEDLGTSQEAAPPHAHRVFQLLQAASGFPGNSSQGSLWRGEG